LIALAFVAAIDDASRIRRSRDIGAYLGLVPRRYQRRGRLRSGNSKCGDRRGADPAVRSRQRHADPYKGQLKLKDWAFAIARRSTMRKARVALARRLAIIMHAMLRNETEFAPAQGRQPTRQETASSSRKERRPREGADDGADSVACGQPTTDCDFNQAALHPGYPIKRRQARRERRHPKASKPGRTSPLDPLENDIGTKQK
jgi:hypothetical protein